MEFVRRFRVSNVFECDSGEGAYRFVRPTGINTSRKSLDFSCPGRDFEVRIEEEKVWLLDDEETVAFGTSVHHRWHLVISDTEYVLDQPKLGANHSTVENQDGNVVAQIRGIGFPVSRIELIDGAGFSTDEKAFVSMIATLSWRESDRRMMGGASTGGGI